MRHALVITLLLLLSAFARPVSAFTPESGFYWNAAEAGRGFTIEIQDNFLFMIGYVYRQDGSSTFITTQGLMQGNAAYQGVLDTFSNGQCTGCPYNGFPNIQPGSAGPVSIVFTSETTATMTWNGGGPPPTRVSSPKLVIGPILKRRPPPAAWWPLFWGCPCTAAPSLSQWKKTNWRKSMRLPNFLPAPTWATICPWRSVLAWRRSARCACLNQAT